MVDFLKQYLPSFQAVKHAVHISVTPDSVTYNVHQGLHSAVLSFQFFQEKFSKYHQNVSESGHLQLFGGGVHQSLKRLTDALQQ